MRFLRSIIPVALVLTACGAPNSYTRATPYPLRDAFGCALAQLQTLEYDVVLADTVGGLLQGRREITGIRETARRAGAAATEVITVGLAGGPRTRYDELTVFVYTRPYPEGNTLETTSGMLIVGDQDRTRGTPSDHVRGDARAIVDRCAPGTTSRR
ncbi:MAG: hypothetical protein LBG44_00105 [Gemmatimonadota bacterium]|jgi:hypothetical protein|nr:hypothetical protein [Gemmatimonadota bacterium]